MARPEQSSSLQSHLDESIVKFPFPRDISSGNTDQKGEPRSTLQPKSVNENDFEKGFGKKRIEKLYHQLKKAPIKMLMTREMAEYHGREAYLKTTIKEILIYILYLFILSILVLESPESDMLPFTTLMAKIFTQNKFRTPEEVKGVHFEDISSIAHIWVYLDQLVVNFEEHLFPQTLQMEKVQKDGLYALHENTLVGQPRLRTVRVKKDSCEIVKEFKNKFKTCFGYFSASQEAVEPFGFRNSSSWRYSSAKETGMHMVLGTVGEYTGTGFYIDCPLETNEFIHILDVLKKGLWIDLATRAFIVDFTVYNANLDLFCTIKLLFEMPPTGGVIPTFFIHTLKLIDFGGKKIGLLPLIVVFLVLIIFYTITELYEMVYFKWDFLKSFWNYLDISIVMMCYLVITLYLYQYITGNQQLVTLVQSDFKYSNFDHMLYVQLVCNLSLSLLVLLSWIKILKYVVINHSIYQLQKTVLLASSNIFWYTLIFLWVFFTFAFTANILFGNQNEFYCTFYSSVWTLINVAVGDFDFSNLEQTSPVMGPIFFIVSLFFLSYIFSVMYIAILLQKYAEVKEKSKSEPAQMKVGDVLKTWTVEFIENVSHTLAIRTQEGFNQRKMRGRFQVERYLLKRCGFTELEVDMYLTRFMTPERRIMTDKDLQDIMLNFQSHGSPGRSLAREMVRHSVAEKLTVLEEAVNNAAQQVVIALRILDTIEKKSIT